MHIRYGMKKDNGFTLIELMVGISLIAILLTLAVPNFTQMVKNNRLSAQANDFIIAVNLARSEAIKRALNVVLCPSADGATCAGGGGWEQGWLIYVDADTSSTLNAGDTILRVFPALSGGNTLRANTASTYGTSITYRPRGFVVNAGSLVLCDDRNRDGDTGDAEDFNMGRTIIISGTGRPHLGRADDLASPFSNCSGS